MRSGRDPSAARALHAGPDAADLRAPIVALASGSGTLLQALLDAAQMPGYPARIVAAGSDRHGSEALKRAERAGVPTFVVAHSEYPDRLDWDAALATELASYSPVLVVSAGFMRLLGSAALSGAPVLNSHPALLPAFPGSHAVRDALAHGVRVTGATLHLVDSGIDTGPIVAQCAVNVRPDDDEPTLHERIKVVERAQLVEYVARIAREGFTVQGRKVTIP